MGGVILKTIHYLYLSIFTFFCFFFLTIFIVNGNQIFFDGPIYQFLTHFSYTDFFKIITKFGDVFGILLFLALSFWLFKNKKDWKFICWMMLLEVVANFVLKNFFARPRPFLPWLVDESGFSFPSGHAMASLMFYGLLLYFIHASHLSLWKKSIFSFFLCFLILMIGLSRIYLGVHYPSDILGGYLVSLCLMSFGIFFYRSMK